MKRQSLIKCYVSSRWEVVAAMDKVKTAHTRKTPQLASTTSMETAAMTIIMSMFIMQAVDTIPIIKRKSMYITKVAATITGIIMITMIT